MRVEASGDALLRTICKLTHIGPKQYAKGKIFVWLMLSPPRQFPYFFILPSSQGDGFAFRDFLATKFPDLVNGCVGRAEMSKRYLYPSLTLLTFVSCAHLPFLAVALILTHTQ